MLTLKLLQRLARYFDLNDIHLYVGLGMLFTGLWLNYSLGLALIVTGSLVAAVAVVTTLVDVFTARAAMPRQPEGKR